MIEFELVAGVFSAAPGSNPNPAPPKPNLVPPSMMV